MAFRTCTGFYQDSSVVWRFGYESLSVHIRNAFVTIPQLIPHPSATCGNCSLMLDLERLM